LFALTELPGRVRTPILVDDEPQDAALFVLQKGDVDFTVAAEEFLLRFRINCDGKPLRTADRLDREVLIFPTDGQPLTASRYAAIASFTRSSCDEDSPFAIGPTPVGRVNRPFPLSRFWSPGYTIYKCAASD
jgi:hypothetical protein